MEGENATTQEDLLFDILYGINTLTIVEKFGYAKLCVIMKARKINEKKFAYTA